MLFQYCCKKHYMQARYIEQEMVLGSKMHIRVNQRAENEQNLLIIDYTERKNGHVLYYHTLCIYISMNSIVVSSSFSHSSKRSFVSST